MERLIRQIEAEKVDFDCEGMNELGAKFEGGMEFKGEKLSGIIKRNVKGTQQLNYISVNCLITDYHLTRYPETTKLFFQHFLSFC